MSPKEKAEILVNSFRIMLMGEDTECGNEILCTLIAIKSSLIAVEEIINGGMNLRYENYINKSDKLNYYDYWREVKQEIENYKTQ
jgi:hypothetical protein